MNPKYKLAGGLVLTEAGLLAQGSSFDAIRNKVYSAINTNIRKGLDMDLDGDGDADMNDYAYVVDLYSDTAIYSMNGQLYSIAYSVTKSATSLGTPVKVEVCYSPTYESAALRLPVATGTHLQEAGYDKTSGKLTITVIKPGFNSSKSRYYKEGALKKGFKVFEGAKMFVNHATAVEEKARPEGDVNQWVGNVTRTWTEADGTIMGEAMVVDPTFKQKLDNLSEAKLLGEMGISIRAIGEAYPGEIDGVETNVIESFIAARSVDFVTYPGAGGRVEAIESDRFDANDVDLMTEAQLRNRRPDLIQVIEAKIQKESDMEKTNEQLKAELKEATDKNTALTTQLQETEKKEKKTAAASELTKLLSESKLPEKAKARIRDRFKEAEATEGMAEAIKEEAEYIAELLPKGTGVKNLGQQHQESGKDEPSDADKAKTKAALKESFISLGSTPEEAEIIASR